MPACRCSLANASLIAGERGAYLQGWISGLSVLPGDTRHDPAAVEESVRRRWWRSVRVQRRARAAGRAALCDRRRARPTRSVDALARRDRARRYGTRRGGDADRLARRPGRPRTAI